MTFIYSQVRPIVKLVLAIFRPAGGGGFDYRDESGLFGPTQFEVIRGGGIRITF